MAEAENDTVSTTEPPPPSPPPVSHHRPTITLPRRPGFESLFSGSGFGLSPGPMTLLSSFFPDGGDSESENRSFSQLVAMKSPGPTSSIVNNSVLMVPPGLSPASLLNSPGLFSGDQVPFGMSHQQTLAQVTVQAAQAQANLHTQVTFPSFVGAGPQSSASIPAGTSESTPQNMMPSALDSKYLKEPSRFSSVDQISQLSSIVVDKPADDGYNWRKYGQKHVKGSEFPRSYYKCTHPSCPVKKKVERSLDGHVTEIIYKGQHNHQPPEKRLKDSGNPNGNLGSQGNPEFVLQSQTGNMNSTSEGIACSLSRRDQESSQATTEHISSDEEEVGDDGARESEEDEDEPDAKRRNMEIKISEQAASHRMVTEPRIIVQTTSEVDLLDDGYRWRKYGQKVVKGNPYPRSYYKCTNQGCNVRKHVERAASDPKAVITTYEGKHNHDVPVARTSSHSTANNSASQLRPHNPGANNYIGKTDFTHNTQPPVALLRVKEERII